MPAVRREVSDTAANILDVAEQLVQVRGFNGFSYADVSDELQITKAALHYHFSTKADLGEALIIRYAVRFQGALRDIEARDGDALVRLGAYTDLYRDVVRNQRMCLCGMLAADYQTLPAPMQRAVTQFFDENLAWLTATVRTGKREGSLAFPGNAGGVAQLIIGALEGAMLVARPFRDVARFNMVADQLIGSLRA